MSETAGTDAVHSRLSLWLSLAPSSISSPEEEDDEDEEVEDEDEEEEEEEEEGEGEERIEEDKLAYVVDGRRAAFMTDRLCSGISAGTMLESVGTFCGGS